jgi:hypothetical protein
LRGMTPRVVRLIYTAPLQSTTAYNMADVYFCCHALGI